MFFPFFDALVAFVTFPSVAPPTASFPSYRSRPYAQYVAGHEAVSSSNGPPTVDLGYEKYQGWRNSSQNLDVFYGIRYAKAPVGDLRWQAPRAPEIDRTGTIDASTYPAKCPQNDVALGYYRPTDNSASSEDCLFLNVWSPSNATRLLPVYVFIHGGCYGAGSGQQDQTPLLYTNKNAFVAVTIQYRLGAFGFLAGDDVHRRGTVNAGLLDQQMSLQWIQQHIHLFNGDATQVTVAGQSAGAGSVMLLNMAYGGSIGTELFANSLAASPYLPKQYAYNDRISSQLFHTFASAAGCHTTYWSRYLGSPGTFDCLVAADIDLLMTASTVVSQLGGYGSCAFVPVTDGIFLQDTPSKHFGRRKVNSRNLLVGTNANEGASYTKPNISTVDNLVDYLAETFPLFSDSDIAKVLDNYPTGNATTDDEALLFATTGDSAPYALSQSSVATGQQQRAELIVSEYQFVCPSYWMVEAFSSNHAGGQGWKYQFSVPPALHGGDTGGYFYYPGAYYSIDITVALQRIWGNFVVHSNPSIDNAVANGVSRPGSNTTQDNPASHWAPYSRETPYQLNLNTTCPGRVTSSDQVLCDAPDAVNEIRMTDGYTWEAGRGKRCDFWKSMGELVPE